MLYRIALVLSVLTVSIPRLVADPNPIEVEWINGFAAEISHVEFLRHRVLSESTVEIEFSLKAVASKCEIYRKLEVVSAQSSLDDGLNPTDLYLRLRTDWEDDCATGSYGDEHTFKAKLKLVRFAGAGNIQYLSFDAGMMGGFNRWLLYRVDLTDLSNIKFQFLKMYSLVQGQIKNF